MPQVKQEVRDRLNQNPGSAEVPGDYCYLYTMAMILHWSKAGNARWANIHLYRKASIQPTLLEGIMEVESLLTMRGVIFEDRQAARDLAFREFYRRVGANYEDAKAIENGDVYAGVPYAASAISVNDHSFTPVDSIAAITSINDVVPDGFKPEISKKEVSNVDNNRTERKGKGR